ncbi:MAG: cellulase family glycosylhydrolase [Deltaproteobacteria bacterium]|nr:cellulase family glycosylhydrolase [Deltaproteobacteria bacterium]
MPEDIKRVLGSFVVLFMIIGALVSCSSKKSSTTLPPLTTKTLSWIKEANGVLVDQYGRQVLLHGVNAKFEDLFDVTFSDGRTRNEDLARFTDAQIQQMAHLGFNFIRLAVNWSGLEPTEGTFSYADLDLLDSVLKSAQNAGIYVLIDYHEDAYSKEIGEDGAPLWAIIPTPTTLLSGPIAQGPNLSCPCYDLNLRRTSAPVLEAFNSFWEDVDSLQERFMPLWQLVASRYADDPAVIGFEDMNEPVAIQTPNGLKLLDDFHVKAAKYLRQVDNNHLFWLEPEVTTRNFSLKYPLRATPFPDRNSVYAFHLYPGLAGLNFSTYGDWFSALTATFNSALAEAQSYGAVPVLDEWGTNLHLGSFADQRPYIAAVLELADERFIGNAFWDWTDFGDSATDSWGCYSWDYTVNGFTASQPGLDTLAEPYLLAVPGRFVSNVFDYATNTLTVTFKANGGEGAPLAYIPHHTYPDGFIVLLDGNQIDVSIDPYTQRVLIPWQGQAGQHTVVIEPQPVQVPVLNKKQGV